MWGIQIGTTLGQATLLIPAIPAAFTVGAVCFGVDRKSRSPRPVSEQPETATATAVIGQNRWEALSLQSYHHVLRTYIEARTLCHLPTYQTF